MSGTGVDRVRREDGLRSHVLRRADQGAGAGQLDFSIDLELFDEAEVEQLDDVTLASLRAQHDVGGLDVAMDQADGVGFGQRAAGHRQDPHHSACRLRAVDRDDPLQGRAVEELHRVVEDAVVGSPVVEDGDGVGVGQARGQLDLALEATKVDLAGPIGPQQLDRRGPPHHAVASPVDLPHSPFADLRSSTYWPSSIAARTFVSSP